MCGEPEVFLVVLARVAPWSAPGALVLIIGCSHGTLCTQAHHTTTANTSELPGTPGLRVKATIYQELQCFYYTYKVFCSYRNMMI